MTRPLLILVLLLSSLVGRAGGHVVGNSADSYKLDHGVAWFRGPAPVRACVELSPSFGFTAGEIVSTIQEVFENWARYRERKEIPMNFPEVQLSTQCRGGEQLVFLMGIETPAVIEARKKYENASALAERTEFDLATARGKGFVWVAAPTPTRDWRLPGRLFGILSHEIGHVLGNEHVADTVMDANILTWLFHSTPAYPEMEFRRIDRAFELVHCSRCAFVADGGIPASNPIEERETFRRFAGREAVGDISARLESKTPFLSSDEDMLSFKLVWTDARGSVEVPITAAKPWNSLRLLDARVFAQLLEKNGTPKVHWRIPFVGFTDGVVREKDGTERVLLLEYNLSYTGSLALSYVPKFGAKRRYLFGGTPR